MADEPGRARDFAALVRAHRVAANLSQQALAEQSSTSVRLISNLERGVAGTPRPSTLAALIHALGLDGAERDEFLRAGKGASVPEGRLSFADLLRTLRERGGLTQDRLAELALVSSRTISDLERGVNRAPRRDTAALMADALGLDSADRAHFDSAVASAAEFVRRRAGRASAHADDPTGPSTPLVGRSTELAAVHSMVSEGGVVTITGTAGVGKTRLAVEFIRQRADTDGARVVFIALSSARTPQDVLYLVARALEVDLDDTGADFDGDAIRAIGGALRETSVLLLLDNLEQVDRAGHVVMRIREVTDRAVLTTSRTALGIAGEQVLRLDPLPVPGDGEREPSSSPAVRLFLDRGLGSAPRWRPEHELDDVAELCRLLDGLPLAIVLAAAAVRTRSVRSISAEVSTRSPRGQLTSKHLPPRQRSLQSALAWSHGLLDPRARRVLARLSVFRDTVDLETAGVICGLDGVDVAAAVRTLNEANLVILTEDDAGEPAVRMLNTIWQFAAERLAESGEADQLAHRLAEVMYSIARTAAPHLVGAEQGLWRAQLTRRLDCLRAADEWFAAHHDTEGDRESAAGFAAALWRYWYLAGRLREGRERVGRALRMLDEHGERPATAEISYGLGVLTYMAGDVAGARELWTRSQAEFERQGAFDGVANSLNNLGMTHLYAGELAFARRFYEQALAAAERSEGTRPVAVTLGNLAKLLVDEGKPEEALSLATRAVPLFAELHDVRAEADLHGLLAEIALAGGDPGQARTQWQDALDGFERLQDPTGIASVLVALAELDLGTGDHPRVRAHVERALSIATDANDPWTTAHAFVVLAELALVDDDRVSAAALSDRAESAAAECNHVSMHVRVQTLRERLTPP